MSDWLSRLEVRWGLVGGLVWILVGAPGARAAEEVPFSFRDADLETVVRETGRLIVPAGRPADTAMHVVRLTYARAEEVAAALHWGVPLGMWILPHRPTNSLIIFGRPAAVDEPAETPGRERRPPDEL